MPLIDLTHEEIASIITAMDYAIDDQDHMLHYGSPAIDYADEWPEVAATKARFVRMWASVCRKLDIDTVQIAVDADNLAEELESAARIADINPAAPIPAACACQGWCDCHKSGWPMGEICDCVRGLDKS